MELESPFFLPLIATFIFFLLVIKIRNTFKTQTQKVISLPPGPHKLPIIGNIHNLMGAHAHQKLRDLAMVYGPVMHLKLGEIDHVIISSPEAAREVTKTRDHNFASRPELLSSKIVLYDGADIAFAPYGASWRQLRKLCTLEILSVRRVRSFSSIREQEVFNVVKEISITDDESPINLSAMSVSLSSSIVCRAITSRKDGTQLEKFLSALEQAIRLTTGFVIPDVFPSFGFIDAVIGVKRELTSCHREMDEVMNEIIKERQAKGEGRISTGDESGVEDLVDVLLRIRDSDQLEIPLNMDNIKAVLIDMFSGGSETSSTIINWTMAELMKNPKVMEKGQAQIRQVLKGKAKIEESDISELHYLKLIIKETLRLHPPLPLLLPRLCGETCEVGGFTILSGTRIIINAWAIGRDPRIWDDPETFKPERFDGSLVDFKGSNFEYLPFGSGRRMCPGMAFGLAAVELALANLLYHFDWKLPCAEMRPEELDMTEKFGVTVGRMRDLHLHATLVHGF